MTGYAYVFSENLIIRAEGKVSGPDDDGQKVRALPYTCTSTQRVSVSGLSEPKFRVDDLIAQSYTTTATTADHTSSR